MDVMAQLDRTTGIQAVHEALHAGLDARLRIVRPVQGVDACLDDVVAQLGHGLEDQVVGREVRRPHVGRVVAEDLHQRGFEQVHLRDDAVVVEGGEVGVRPAGSGVSGDSMLSVFDGSPVAKARGACMLRGHVRVRANLVALRNDAMDQGLVIGAEDVGPVVAVDEERRVDVVVLQRVEDLGRVDVRAVIERQGNGSRHGAALDDGPERHRGACRRREGYGFGGLDPWGGLGPRSSPRSDPSAGLGPAGWGWRGEYGRSPGAEEHKLVSKPHSDRRQVLLAASSCEDQSK